MIKPRLSIHMMARDVAPEVVRALRSVKTGIEPPALDTELVLVDTGSTDGTPEAARETCLELGFGFDLVEVSPASNPELYFPDVPESYERKIPFPCSGKQLLRDWSIPRNLGLERCQGDYVLKLDADDVCLLPGEIPKILDRLDADPSVAFARALYEVMDPVAGRRDYVTNYTRIWQNHPTIRFREVCHENVDWRRATLGNTLTWDPIIFRDLRDGPRTLGRNYKVLLREHERSVAGANPPHVLLYLADESCREDPTLALECILLLGEHDLLPIDRAWARTVAGIAHEKLGNHLQAVAEYEKAAVLWPRVRFLLESLWVQKGGCYANRDTLAGLARLNRVGFYPASASETEIRRALEGLQEDEKLESQTLKPCPHCGGTNVYVDDTSDLEFLEIPTYSYHHWVICQTCDDEGYQVIVGGKYVGDGKSPRTEEQRTESRDSAIFAWNRRA